MALLLNGLFSLFFNGFMLSSYPGIKVWTRVECANRCLANTTCLWFFHSKKSGLCQIVNYKTISDVTFVRDVDARCYRFYIDTCPIARGYKLSRDPALCYRIRHWNLAHADASSACQEDGGFLIRIDSQEKQDYIAWHLEDMAKNTALWIDGSNNNSEGEWRFSDGTLMTYLNWSDDDSSHDGDCVQILGKNFTWIENDCDQASNYICELPSA